MKINKSTIPWKKDMGNMANDATRPPITIVFFVSLNFFIALSQKGTDTSAAKRKTAKIIITSSGLACMTKLIKYTALPVNKLVATYQAFTVIKNTTKL